MVNEYRKILYGDDNEQNRSRVAQALRKRGYNVDSVNSPQEFVLRARSGDYNVVISDLDYSPEGAEGYGIMRQIMQIPTLKILFTGRSGFENIAEGIENGADFVITSKSLDDLINLLERELKGSERENGR